ncbi:hypothetical protein HOD05_01580 [Candidatus Woesearchaeota archaeon]|jgi:tRNA uracil 4-sulfurtransferase|nr:hypothetical protein [Candidatus Woesearchaeota archaeon]MBT4151157.1 hypothetical protein [Candidatus Woesearchaeota archaeon]MBT4247623.1 hypothetical protein [Candidatus Woesearchaeota archaeon]MBT4433886.1 hypothetical protein [Candidatus Woesearchaeota archaeon]MBT7331857.1 hypothetical protein [Candidatus Woesearchaeota archaeon]
MNYSHILLRYGEIFLKGKNKNFFEKKLAQNIKKIVGVSSVNRLRSRFVCEYIDNHKDLKQVFGLTSYSLALRVEKEPEFIKDEVVKFVSKLNGTFKIATKRSDKQFPIGSMDFNVEVGGYIEAKTDLEFNFENPDHLINIEINQDAAYIFIESIPCFGGLPTGVEGKVLLLVEDKSSILAGLLFMKRGTNIFPVAYKEKDISLLQKYSPMQLNLDIVKDIPTDKDMDILVSGQNFENLNDYKTELLVLRPLIAFDNVEIQEMLDMYSK